MSLSPSGSLKVLVALTHRHGHLSHYRHSISTVVYIRTAPFYLTFSMDSYLDELGWEHGTQRDLSPACLAHPFKYSSTVNVFIP